MGVCSLCKPCRQEWRTGKNDCWIELANDIVIIILAIDKAGQNIWAFASMYATPYEIDDSNIVDTIYNKNTVLKRLSTEIWNPYTALPLSTPRLFVKGQKHIVVENT
jgi:hypothetical protein